MEIERRFIVTEWKPSVLDGLRPQQIRQGYIPTPPDRSVSIRIVDDAKAWYRPKFGKGISRDDSRECAMDVRLARSQLAIICPDQVRKDRYCIPVEGNPHEKWEVDRFYGSLEGLIVVERELSSVDAPVVKPDWIMEWMEVTDQLTNQHLARIATELRGLTLDRQIYQYILQQPAVPLVVLTGGPCSNKSTTLRALSERFVQAHVVPEVATILIGQIGLKPPVDSPVAIRQFQHTVFRVQRAFEEESCRHAVRIGKNLVIMDRGTVDCAAYLSGGVNELEGITGVPTQYEYARYQQVICLETPSRDIYEANQHNNAARSETYEQAKERAERTSAAWRAHPRFHRVVSTPTPQEKIDHVIGLIEKRAPLVA